MKKLLIMLGTILLVNSSTMFADTIPAENKSSKIVEIPKTFEGNFIPPTYYVGTKLNPFHNLQYLMRKTYKREQHIVKTISGSTPMSKFQLIVDKKGHIVDCTLLESTNMIKDRTVLQFFQNEFLFSYPATLDGEPCSIIGIFSIRYDQPPTQENIKFDCYPLIDTSI